MRPRAVVLDADGVVQRNPDGWLDALRAVAPPGRGEEFTEDLFGREHAAMVGDRDFRDVLSELVTRWGLSADVTELLEHWRRVEVWAPTLDVVAVLRTAGVRCYLATNQNPYRCGYMKDTLGYDRVFDGGFYSCELGVTKSSPTFFTRLLEQLGLEAGEVLFVDDSEEYVDSARAAGLVAERWAIDDGIERLRALLAGHGLPA